MTRGVTFILHLKCSKKYCKETHAITDTRKSFTEKDAHELGERLGWDVENGLCPKCKKGAEE